MSMPGEADREMNKFVVDKADLFKRACEINALRRDSGLPLRSISEVMQAEEDRLAWAEYTAVVGQYQYVYEQLRNKVRQDSIKAGKGDIALSSGGKWLLAYKAMQQFEEFLETKGHFRPRLKGIPYGPATAQ